MKILAIFTSLLSLALAQDYLCTDIPDNSFLPSDESCSLYFKCINSVAYLLSCPLEQYFNSAIGRCDLAGNVECDDDFSTTLEPTRSPPPGPNVNCDGTNEFDYLPSPVDCSKYYQCVGGDPFLLSCPRGLYFSVELRSCTTYDEANCVITPPGTLPPPPTSPGPPPSVSCDGVPNFRFVSSPRSCSVSINFKTDFISWICFLFQQNYYQCIDGNAFLLSCPLDQHFDELRQTCDSVENVNCELTPTPPTTTIRPLLPSCENVENFQFIRSPSSCNEYFQCIDEIPFLLTCPRGLYFNERIQTCDQPANVDCVTGTPSTTPEPPLGVSCENVEDFQLLSHPSSCALYFLLWSLFSPY